MKNILLSLIALVIASSMIIAQETSTDNPEDKVTVELGRTADQYYNVGNWYAERQQHVKAVAYFKAALNKKSDFTGALINLGSSLKELKRFDEAIDSYQKAIDHKTKENFV